MPLVECRECGHQVSSEAVACPHCGCPRPAWTVADSTTTPPTSAGNQDRQQEAAIRCTSQVLPAPNKGKRELSSGALAAAVAMVPIAPVGALVLVPIIGLVWGRDYLRWRA